MRLIWVAAGLLSLGLGIVGVFLPLLPTVPFLLLAAFCFARSSERLLNWLLSHPRFGPAIIDWRERGAVSLRAKQLATFSVAVVFGISLALGLRLEILLVQGLALIAVLIFLWTRPSY